MTYTLKNENLTVTVNSLGAEVVSVKDRNGRELWWNGDPAFWKGHSPILFPACGGLWNGKYMLNGKEYNMPKHGFVRGMEFDVDKESPVLESDEVSEVSFTVTGNEDTAACFPFKWRLTLTYTLRGEQLECEAEVQNLGDETMHYQIGGQTFEVITRTGFDDKYNYGCPSFLSTEEGLYFGTCNPFYGGQLFLLSEEGDERKDIVSGITTVDTVKKHDNIFYTLNGQRVAKPNRPGIYLQNGKKTVVNK